MQLNLDGFFPCCENVQLFTKDFNPALICLQETNFKHALCAKIGGYDSLSKTTQTRISRVEVLQFILKNLCTIKKPQH